jgi:hypothetical protein
MSLVKQAQRKSTNINEIRKYRHGYNQEDRAILRAWLSKVETEKELDFLRLEPDSAAEKDLEARLIQIFESDERIKHLSRSRKETEGLVRDLRLARQTVLRSFENRKKGKSTAGEDEETEETSANKYRIMAENERYQLRDGLIGAKAWEERQSAHRQVGERIRI